MLSRRSPGRPAAAGPAEPPGARCGEPLAPDRPPLVTYTLIGLCVLAFLVGPVAGLDPVYGSGHDQLCAQAGYFARWGVIPSELWHGALPPDALSLPAGCRAGGPSGKLPALSVLTALFVHGGWTHLLGNMLFLFVFGPAVEDRVGRTRYAVFYLVAGYVATYGYAYGHAGSTQTLIGASGAIAGVLGAFLFLYPRARVTSLLPFLLFLPLRFPAWLVLGFWFALQWFASRTAQAAPGVAYLAHVIGFGFGFLCAAAAYRERSKLTPQAATRGDSQP
ncbi:rhomboid family intramembrane serine protease [Streptomyces sp. SL13]|jgi:membrane associated rhomboid family serine protease|uniref:Rhomboid family intramembrane serine protease n=1 Tax=Streptantibioticus silvisoli TaxID=2705255 RepID=A0AA90GYX5_9ACTN|nr:rhomboid family intramembrane serine protease [Streptantibioticus silvisoli]MDI5963527.1 rhomboid family intramembrane serine protease [Streptantibioticus silvisoli]MDI5970194.1 rhomboid family intramembrane serine protease [Streptantibioticus silvisoli]